jgi:hypothetical protein
VPFFWKGTKNQSNPVNPVKKIFESQKKQASHFQVKIILRPVRNQPMRYPLEIEVSDYIYDHQFEGRCVLPAVEALIVLAKVVRDHVPNADLQGLNKARFPRFLVIPEEVRHLPGIVEIDQSLDGNISASLMTLLRSKTGGIGRSLEHSRVEFFLSGPDPLSSPPFPVADISDAPAAIVPEGSIYPGLIPFGKAFQNITGPVSLWPEGASARLSGGNEGPEDTPLGSPFPLDAAFHVACIWGQRFSEYVLFPVGFEKRTIHQKTQKGDFYLSWIFPVEGGPDVFRFDALIVDSLGTIYEVIRGIQMQDVSQGRLHPPSWIKTL